MELRIHLLCSVLTLAQNYINKTGLDLVQLHSNQFTAELIKFCIDNCNGVAHCQGEDLWTLSGPCQNQASSDLILGRTLPCCFILII